jgi:hypothetical protein
MFVATLQNDFLVKPSFNNKRQTSSSMHVSSKFDTPKTCAVERASSKPRRGRLWGAAKQRCHSKEKRCSTVSPLTCSVCRLSLASSLVAAPKPKAICTRSSFQKTHQCQDPSLCLHCSPRPSFSLAFSSCWNC